MQPITVEQLCRIVQGKVVYGTPDAIVRGVTIDSRKVNPGDLFVAFRGERADGHDYVPAALEQGAAAVLVSRDIPPLPGGTVVRVEDPLRAVQALASWERRQFTGPVIGVTGSNGKTTTKEMLAAVFQTQGPCLYTQGNLNNELGLPLTLLRRQPADRFIVLEMGMRGRGQIAELCRIAEPTAGIITNIGHSHIELLGSQEAIAHAKAELLEAIPASGVAALWHDDPWLHRVADRCKGRVYWFGRPGAPDAYAEQITTSWSGTRFVAHVLGESAEVFLPTYGEHNVWNALGALLLGAVHGLPLSEMAEGLRTFQPTSGRLLVRTGRDGRRVLDDCYNASPASMKASLRVLQQLGGGTTVAILGDMLELGDYEETGHREVGRWAASLGISRLVTVGERARLIAEEAAAAGHPDVHAYREQSELAAHLDALVPANSTVLVKASRAMQFEKIVAALV